MNKLYKSENGKMLCGVCAGLSEFLRVDVNILRIIAVVSAFAGGIGLVAYIAAALLLPFKDDSIQPPQA